MTSLPSPPANRRTRRNVVTIVMLALVSLVSWWYWPRGDARFVGKWRVEPHLEGINHLSGGSFKEHLIHFFPNGLGQEVGDGRVFCEFHWRLNGEELQMQEFVMPSRLYDQIRHWMRWQFTGFQFDPKGYYVERNDIVIHDWNTVTLRPVDGKPNAFMRFTSRTLHRLTE